MYINIYNIVIIFIINKYAYGYNLNYIYNKNRKSIKKFPEFYYKKIHNITMKEFVFDDMFVPDMQRRSIMNKILLMSTGLPVSWMLFGFLYFLIPESKNNLDNGIFAKDKNGNDIYENEWIKNNLYPNRNLVEGLKGDAHYLIVKQDNTLEKYAINAVCTHLGCVVPWNKQANKFMCPCHGSQYDSTGKVIRGPAPLSLKIANVNVENNKVILSDYTVLDFRDNKTPWWIK